MPLVAILLGTYNGERFLVEQLRSIESQEHTNWVVYASDDGSTDKTLEILLEFQHEWPEGKLIIRQGPKKGFAKNFLSFSIIYFSYQLSKFVGSKHCWRQYNGF